MLLERKDVRPYVCYGGLGVCGGGRLWLGGDGVGIIMVGPREMQPRDLRGELP